MIRAPKYDLTNQRFGYYVVSKYLGYSYWECICDCGNVFKRMSSNIRTKTCISCGCIRKKGGTYSPTWQGVGDIGGFYLNRVFTSARNGNKEFDLTVDYLWDLFIEQEKRCAISGFPLTPPKSAKEPFSASLDRVDSNQGYIKGNVQWVHRDLNFMKQDFSMEYFLHLCKSVVSSFDIEYDYDFNTYSGEITHKQINPHGKTTTFKITRSKWKEIYEKYENGISQYKLAEEYDMSQTGIGWILKRYKQLYLNKKDKK